MNRIILLSISFLLLFGCNDLGSHLSFNNGDLYYTRNVALEDANKLGEYLVEAGFYDGTEKTIQLDKRNDTFLLRMVVKEEMQDNKESNALLSFFASALSWKVFNGAAVEAHICDDHLKTVKVIDAVSLSLPAYDEDVSD